MKNLASLPTHIGRPLYFGAIALLAFLLAVVGWAGYAPLSTSIHLNGSLLSERPSFDLQHAFGGQIEWVGVRAQEQVTKGQSLLRLDVSLERANLTEIEAQLEALQAENDAISAVLDGDVGALGAHSTISAIVERVRLKEEANRQRTDSLFKQAESLEEQALAVEREIALLAQSIALGKKSEARVSILIRKSFARDADLMVTQKEILNLAGQREQRLADLSDLLEKASRAKSDAIATNAEYLSGLLLRLQENTARLSEVRKEAARLRAIVAASNLTSPVDGQVQHLSYASSHMYAPRGQTLLTIAQELETPRIKLMVSATVIDQVHLGMKGRLTITSLSQRDVPIIYVKIIAISPIAEKDSEGKVLGYTAEAELDQASYSGAFPSIEEHLRLSTDMPVSVVLEGRKSNLASYIFAPMFSAFSGAFQD